MKRNGTRKLISLTFLWLSNFAIAEYSYDYSKLLSDPSQAQWTNADETQTVTQARDEKAQIAQDKSNKGATAAMATGSSLMSVGVPMLASPFDAVRVEGADLVAKGMSELVQAGADGDASRANGYQKDLLRAAAGSGAGDHESPIQKALGNAQLNKILTDNGINPQDFGQKFASGSLNNPEDFLRALGDKRDISDDAKALGLAAANAQLASVLGKDTQVGLTLDDSAKNSVSSPGDGSDFGASSFRDGSATPVTAPRAGGNASGLAGLSNGLSTNPAARALASAANRELAKSLEKVHDTSFLEGLVAQFNKLDPDGANLSQARNALEMIGISLPVKSQNIFQKVHRNYRSFGKWRKDSRLAAK